jgi:hypothetical protein
LSLSRRLPSGLAPRRNQPRVEAEEWQEE